MNINKSPTLKKYKDTMKQCINLYYPDLNEKEVDNILDYSINKRIKDTPVKLNNSYTHKDVNTTLLKMSDYIMSREPIVTAFGTMFKHHGEVPNPLFDVVDSFLNLRSKHKKQMFKYPKGSEDFEKYNLLQTLDKIDANGIMMPIL